jgi:hypothetical protein
MTRSTHTVALLEVSKETWSEIAKRLRAAGYDHAFIGDVIDMTGIGLVALPTTLRRCEPCNGPGPTLWDPKSLRYACVRCHSDPNDSFFSEPLT